jgi:hypothetical protein
VVPAAVPDASDDDENQREAVAQRRQGLKAATIGGGVIASSAFVSERHNGHDPA